MPWRYAPSRVPSDPQPPPAWSSKWHTNPRIRAKFHNREGSRPRGRIYRTLLFWPLDRDVPNLFGILTDRAVGGEPRHVRNVERAHACPGGSVMPKLVDRALGRVIGVKVGRDHVVVVVAERIGERQEPRTVAVREFAGFKRADCV